MIVLEFKARVKPDQATTIDDAIRTSQFVRNKALRYWMDSQDVGKYDLSKLCKALAGEFPFAKKLNSMSRQAAAERAWSSISRFYDNCKKGIKPVGFPKFKKHSRSVEYKTSGWKLLGPKRIKFTDGFGIGELRLIGTYDLARYDESLIKRVRLVRRADGYYVQFCIQVNVQVQSEPSQKAVGLDLGLRHFIAASDGTVVETPQFYRQAEKRLNRANRQKSRKYRKGAKPQSRNYHKARNRYARKHLRVSRQRNEWAKSIAYCVIQSNDLVAYVGEACTKCIDLNVKGLVRNRHLAKSISDAGWSTFRRWLEYFGRKYGKATVAVPPHYTSQDCSNCGERVNKALSVRTHRCPHCGYEADRDVNAAINILRLGLTTVGHTGSYTLGEIGPLAELEQSC
ncbi:RNA-guided endonuclease InsQ/TnpB family protein [Spirulina major]|uniref:RNA-guided endonuclease InsQ/TnpB family protein n=1 Tax=Spirulina major TaxID=270636 RepID=UPI000B2BCF53|nr:RNA-guided endonuclease TnpB family protein [Spirulina major]